MGDDAVILEGVANEKSAELLYSTVPGAGLYLDAWRLSDAFSARRWTTGSEREALC